MVSTDSTSTDLASSPKEPHARSRRSLQDSVIPSHESSTSHGGHRRRQVDRNINHMARLHIVYYYHTASGIDTLIHKPKALAGNDGTEDRGHDGICFYRHHCNAVNLHISDRQRCPIVRATAVLAHKTGICISPWTWHLDSQHPSWQQHCQRLLATESIAADICVSQALHLAITPV